MALVDDLLTQGLMVIGNQVHGDLEPWTHPREVALARLRYELNDLPAKFWMAGARLENTAAGDARARSILEQEAAQDSAPRAVAASITHETDILPCMVDFLHALEREGP